MPAILLIGTMHWRELSAEHQAAWEFEAQEIASDLARFRPTCIAVECRPEDEPIVLDRYERFLEGAQLRNSEIEQLSFRVAQRSGVKAIRGFDADWDLEFGRLQQLYPDEAALSEAMSACAPVETVRAREESDRASSLRDALIIMSSPEYQSSDHRHYLRIAELGSERQSGGAEYVASWYLRNLRMYGTLCRLGVPDERVLAVVGAGHARILNDFLRDGGRFDVAYPRDYLARRFS